MHILALAVLLAATLPFAGSDGPGTKETHYQTVAATMPDCDMHGAAVASGAGCQGMTMHCLSLVVPEPDLYGVTPTMIVVHHRLLAIHASSRAPEAESPPPRA